MRTGLLALCGLLGACGAPTHTSGSYSFEFRILAGAEPSIPAKGDDAISLARDDTANGGAAGVAWVAKSYDSIATTGPTGDLTALVGIWGTFEVARTYYLDSLAVQFTERP